LHKEWGERVGGGDDDKRKKKKHVREREEKLLGLGLN
jgi:hypothetical protein